MTQRNSDNTDAKIISLAFLSAGLGAATAWLITNRTNKKVTKNRLFRALQELTVFGEQLKADVTTQAKPKAKARPKPAAKKIKAIKHEPLNEEEAEHIRKNGEP